MHRNKPVKVALLWRGDPEAPNSPTHYASRLQPVFEALHAEGMHPESVLYFDEDKAATGDRLALFDAVLVWINPLQDGRNRAGVDAMLRDLVARGVWVSADPDTIDKMGVKEVLYATRQLGWGSATELYGSQEEFDARFPALVANGPRVLKPNRGNDGRSVLKVERFPQSGLLRVQQAFDDAVEVIELHDLRARTAPAFENGGKIIDQEFHATTSQGMVRCYMSLDRVVGFARQRPRRENPPLDQPAFAMNSAKEMHDADAPEFADLRAQMETEWTPGLQRLLRIERRDLPVLWDADFLARAPSDRPAASRHVLCEINASCVSPFPPTAPVAIARAVKARLV